MKTDCFCTVVIALLACLLASTAWATWSNSTFENNAVCEAAGDQHNAMATSDGAGGMIIVWDDDRSGYTDLYAQRVDAWGNALWQTDGVVVCGASDAQNVAGIVGDGSGGAIVVWQDYRSGADSDVYAQRVDASGAALWGSGVAVSSGAGDQDSPALVSDAAGGAIIAWEDDRSGAGGGDIYAQRIGSSGATVWPGAVAVAFDTIGTRRSIGIAPDGSGGAVLAWVDGGVLAARLDDAGTEVWRSSGYVVGGSGDHPAVMGDGFGGAMIACEDKAVPSDIDIVAQRVDALGGLLWGASGVTVCGSSGNQERPRLVTDGSAGAILTWHDHSSNIYVQRVSNLGVVLWAGTGMPVSVGIQNTSDPRLVADGAGGAVVVWHGGLADNEDAYAQRVDGSGVAHWTANGEVVSNAYGYQREPAAVGDGAGGVLVAWEDLRNSVDADIYAQRVERNGFLGYPAPAITSVIDHPDDQGGEIVVSWAPSYLDVWPCDEVDLYTVWHRYGGTSLSRQRTAAWARTVDWSHPEAVGCSAVQDYADVLERYGWAMAGQVQAYQLPEYACIVPSFGDSSDAGVVLTDVMVIAHSYLIDDRWLSEPGTGYSIDNWAPGAPGDLVAQVVGINVELSWAASHYRDEDLSHYNVHRSDVAGFTPDASSFIGGAPDTLFTDHNPGEGTWYYRVIAEDVHGNESAPSGVTSATTETGIDEQELSAVLTIRGNTPNPFNPTTEIVFDVPERSNVRLAVYAPDGRCVAVLADRLMVAGRHRIAWHGCDTEGNELPSGVYFYRLVAGDFAEQRKMVLIK